MHKVVEHYKNAPPREDTLLSDERAVFAQWNEHHTLTPVQFLRIFHYSMKADESHLSFDYFALMQRCMHFLHDLRDALCRTG